MFGVLSQKYQHSFSPFYSKTLLFHKLKSNFNELTLLAQKEREES